jgi:hypothetical protein
VIFLELSSTYDVIVNGVSCTKSYVKEQKKKERNKKKHIRSLKSMRRTLTEKEKVLKQNINFGILPENSKDEGNHPSKKVKGMFLLCAEINFYRF